MSDNGSLRSASLEHPDVDAPIPSRHKLVSLTSLRFFAALHIFVFHMAALPSAEELEQLRVRMRESQTARSETEAQVETAVLEVAETDRRSDAIEAGRSLPRNQSTDGPTTTATRNRGLYGALPRPISRLVRRGYCSTSLFFMLSGFILAYLYIDGQGNQTISDRDFWLARWVRVYPLHLLVLFLLVPGVIFILRMNSSPTLWGVPVSKPAHIVISGIMSLLLIQAWCPEVALRWNFATWALSAVVFFYAMFPAIVRLLKGRSRRTLWFWFWMMPIFNLIPTIVYLRYVDESAADAFFWTELVTRTPLLWLPHFAMAIILARLFNITRYDMRWMNVNSTGIWGDFAGVLIIVLLMTPDNLFQTLLGLGTKPPNLILRHGLFAPIYSVFIYHLAIGRGFFQRILSFPWFEKLGEASFGIFILQGPAMFPSMLMFGWIRNPVIRVLLMALLVFTMAMLSLRLFERPIATCLKKRWNIASSAA